MITNPIDQLRHAARLERCGQYAEAIEYCKRALNQQPDNADALHLLGVLEFRCKEIDRAIDLIFQAVQKDPRVPDYHNSLGIAVAVKGDTQTAVKAFRKAVGLRPDYAEAWNNMAAALQEENKFEEALISIDRAISSRNDYAEAHHRRGLLLAKVSRWKQAADAHRRAIELHLPWDQGIEPLIESLERSRQFKEAIDWSRRHVQVTPTAKAYNRLGRVLREAGQFAEAILAHQSAVSIDPTRVFSYQNLAICYWRQSKLDCSIESYRKALELGPDNATVGSDLIFSMLHDPLSTPEMVLKQCKQWARSHEVYSPPTHRSSHNPNRRLRVGYVSGDFRRHTIAHVIGPILKLHDRQQVEIYCYSSVQQPDHTTARLRKDSDHWRDILSKSDSQIAQMITDDKIDILVDLAGHMGGNHLRLFTIKPAPIQVQLAYAGTTGLKAMDYRLTDAYSDPPGMTESHYTERLLYQPTAWVYEPDAKSPDVGPLPASQEGYLTFCSPNRPIKITDQVIELWGQILHAVSESRLLVLAEGQGEETRYLRERFTNRGIDESRLELLPRLSRAKYMAQFNRIDIVLDTFPYNGDTTTCDALWMGVPVITLEGDTFRSRRGMGILTCMGLPELVGKTPPEYVKIAAELAKDLPRLAELRTTLRNRLAHSPVTDGFSYTKQLEHNYRQVWHEWCERVDTSAIDATPSQAEQRGDNRGKAETRAKHLKNSLCILFAHHRSDAVTRHHLHVLQQHNPHDPVVLLCNGSIDPLAGAIDVSQLSDEFAGENKWLGSDVMLYLWFRHCRNIEAERYAIIEWDTLATMPLREYYRDVWDADAAGCGLKTPQHSPTWEWFVAHGSRLPEPLRTHMVGLVPFNGILLSHRALEQICQQEIPRHINNELRLGTLLSTCGFQLKTIGPAAASNNQWRADQIKISGRPGLYHPVKSILPDLAGTNKVARFRPKAAKQKLLRR